MHTTGMNRVFISSISGDPIGVLTLKDICKHILALEQKK
jgi:hypothetical protein